MISQTPEDKDHPQPGRWSRRNFLKAGIATAAAAVVYDISQPEAGQWPDNAPLQLPEVDLPKDAPLKDRREQFFNRYKEFNRAMDDLLTQGGELGGYIRENWRHYVRTGVTIHFCPANKNGTPPFCKIGNEQKDFNVVVNLFTRYAALCRAQNALSKEESVSLPKVLPIESFADHIIEESHKRESNPDYEDQLQALARIVQKALKAAGDFCDVSLHYKGSEPVRGGGGNRKKCEQFTQALPTPIGNISINVIVENPYALGQVIPGVAVHAPSR